MMQAALEESASKYDALEKNLQKLLLKKEEVHKNQLEEKEDLKEGAGEGALRQRKTSRRRSSLKKMKASRRRWVNSEAGTQGREEKERELEETLLKMAERKKIKQKQEQEEKSFCLFWKWKLVTKSSKSTSWSRPLKPSLSFKNLQRVQRVAQ